MLKKLIFSFVGISLYQGIVLPQAGMPADKTAYALGFSTYLSIRTNMRLVFDIHTDDDGFT